MRQRWAEARQVHTGSRHVPLLSATGSSERVNVVKRRSVSSNLLTACCLQTFTPFVNSRSHWHVASPDCSSRSSASKANSSGRCVCVHRLSEQRLCEEAGRLTYRNGKTERSWWVPQRRKKRRKTTHQTFAAAVAPLLLDTAAPYTEFHLMVDLARRYGPCKPIECSVNVTWPTGGALRRVLNE